MQRGESLVGHQRFARLQTGRVRRLRRLGLLGNRDSSGVGPQCLGDLSLVGLPVDSRCGALVLLGFVLDLEAFEPLVYLGVEVLGVLVIVVLVVLCSHTVK